MPHPISDAALQQHLAILGKTGAGKSFAARSIVERLLDAGRRVCVLDYTACGLGCGPQPTAARARIRS